MTSTAPSLLSLPLEIRLRIFGLLFSTPRDLGCKCQEYRWLSVAYLLTHDLGHDITLKRNHALTHVGGRPRMNNLLLPYLLVNKQVTKELLEYMAQKQTIHFKLCGRVCLRRWVKKVGYKEKGAIRRIHFQYRITDNDHQEVRDQARNGEIRPRMEGYRTILSQADCQALSTYYRKVQLLKYQITSQYLPHHVTMNLDAEFEVENPVLCVENAVE